MISKSKKPLAYSYIRFSTPEQARGDSLRRQVALSVDWCERNGYELDTTLNLRDLGVSAHKSKNAIEGKLSAFLKGIETGMIPKGATLLVESLDRLSRDEVLVALEMFIRILRGGITLVTLNPPEQTFTLKSVSKNHMLLMTVIIEMTRAHAESDLKSTRIGTAKEKAREKARSDLAKLTANAPGWLDALEAKDVKRGETAFKVTSQKAVETINRIFKLRKKGYGADLIVKALNTDPNAWRPRIKVIPRGPATEDGMKGEPLGPSEWQDTNGWRRGYVNKILVSRAVLGECQMYSTEDGKQVKAGEPIPNYFPAVVKSELFFAVQKKVADNKGKGGRNGKHQNLFKNLVKCPYCGWSLELENKGYKHSLVCSKYKMGLGCGRHAVSYAECEETILENCHKLQFDQVLPNTDEQQSYCSGLRESLHGIDGEVESLEAKIENAAERAAEAPDKESGARVYSQMKKFEANKAKLMEKRTLVEKDLDKAELSVKTVETWQRNFASLKKALASGDADVRVRMNNHLKDLLDKIEIFGRGHRSLLADMPRTPLKTKGKPTVAKNGRQSAPYVIRQDGESLAESLEAGLEEVDYAFAHSDEFQGFLEFLTEKRMSKAGRFIRLHFKSGATFDIVPSGSLASGKALIRRARGANEWRFVSPDTDRLWREYKAECCGKQNRAKLSSV